MSPPAHRVNKGTYRCTFTLPQELATNISVIAKAMKISQSSLLALLLEEPIEMIAKLVSILPAQSVPGAVPEDVIRRLRGASVDGLRTAVTDALDMAKGLDPGFKL